MLVGLGYLFRTVVWTRVSSCGERGSRGCGSCERGVEASAFTWKQQKKKSVSVRREKRWESF